MHLEYFNKLNLPFRELEMIGLSKEGELMMNVNDLKALLSGRRTGLIHLENLESENIKIKAIDAKLSLRENAEGKTDLLIHPVYRKPDTPAFLDDFEAEQLEKGEVGNFLKITKDDKGNKKELVVEYDPDTREFIVSDTEKILVPDMINSEYLTAAQKENYKKGKEVTVADGTTVQYSGTDPNGIRADKLALVASILIDGGLTYMVYKGLNALFNKERKEEQAAKLSPGYHNAVRDAEEQRIDYSDNFPAARKTVAR